MRSRRLARSDAGENMTPPTERPISIRDRIWRTTFYIAVVVASATIVGAVLSFSSSIVSAQVPTPPPIPHDISCTATSTGFCCGQPGPTGPVLRCVNSAGEPMPWQNPFTPKPAGGQN